MKILFTFLIALATIASSYAGNGVTDSVAVQVSSVDSAQIKVAQYIYKAVTNGDSKPQLALKYYRSALLANRKNDLWEAEIRKEMAKLLFKAKSPDAFTQLLKA